MEPRTVLLFALALGACTPEIGDECETSTDCSQSGDRLCDITQPGGYCTVFDCEPDTCPEGSVCVLFGENRSRVDGCQDPLGAGPYQRTFCLKTCENNSDCRDQYGCVNIRKEATAGGAVVIDGFSKVCSVRAKDRAAIPAARPGDVCTGTVTEPDGGAPDGG